MHELPYTVGKLQSDEVKTAEASQPAQGKWGMHLRDVSADMAKPRGLTTDHAVLVAEGSPCQTSRCGVRR